ncbi:MAG TPA: DUF3617 domain-containing protein [Noviherbaspirillum sp.]|nr:DUF3617 domain-containing protein [Noviherbaspirillum sp.]
MKRKTALPFLLGAMISASAMAEPQMKPGLWEMTVKSDAMKNMPQMPPEQVEQMRKMGIEVPQFKNGAMVSRVCITPQMAAQGAAGFEKYDSGCVAKNRQVSGNGYKADIVCTGAALNGSGKVSGTYSGGDKFSSSYDFKGTSHGQPVSHRQDSAGRWLGADCGSVKPFGQ